MGNEQTNQLRYEQANKNHNEENILQVSNKQQVYLQDVKMSDYLQI